MADNPPITIYDNKIENWVTFVIKAGYHLQLLTLETVKLIGSAKSKINKDALFRNYWTTTSPL